MAIITIIGVWLVLGFFIGTFVGKIIYQNSTALDEDNINN